ncbi:MAG: response regulator [bacterium]|nr:response regulator [bacterium]
MTTRRTAEKVRFPISETEVLGLPVRAKPEWTDVDIGEKHRLTLRVVGDHILATRPVGFAERHELVAALDLVQHVAETCFHGEWPTVWISDYSEVGGTTREGRSYFPARLAQWDRLHLLILCSIPAKLKVLVKLGVKLKLVPFDVLIAEDFEAGLRLAIDVVADFESAKVPKLQTFEGPVEGEWSLSDADFFIRFSIVDNRILLVVVEGTPEDRHLDSIFELQERITRRSDLAKNPYAIVADFTAMTAISRAARWGYLRRITHLHKTHPFAVEVFCGANPLLRGAISLTSPFAPFDVQVAKSRNEAINLASEVLDSQTQPPHIDLLPNGSAGDLRCYVDELMLTLGALNWDSGDRGGRRAISDDHPFAEVFQMIRMLESDIQDLLVERAKAEDERRLLQESVARTRKMEALGLLAGGVAHDLNNVLTGLVSYPDLLLTDPTLSSQHRSALLTIKQSGEQAAAIVSDLLTIARGVALKTEPVSLNEIAGVYLDSLEFKRLRHHHPGPIVSTRFEETIPLVRGSAIHLRKAIMNLVSNAVEAVEVLGEEGRVTIRTLLRNVESHPTHNGELATGIYVVLRVTDNGGGISPEDVERVFEPFYTKKVLGRSGTGLGLTVVWNTAQDHAGFVEVESVSGSTRFDLFLPATDEVAPICGRSVPVEEYRGNGETILVVDDMENQRRIAKALLESLGYVVETVASGEEAVTRIRDHTFDLVILDMIMDPGIDGAETCERIHNIRPGQRALIASGYSATENVKRALAPGGGSFIAKPYSMETIGVAIRDALRTRDVSSFGKHGRPGETL